MDIRYLLWLQDFRNATNNFFTTFMKKITLCGEGYIAFLLLLIFFWCFDKKFGIRALMSLGVARIFNGFIKLCVCAYRPWIRSKLIEPADGAKTTATGYSFPSGHSTNATVSFGQVGWYYRKKNKIIMWTLFAFTLLVMLSRNYLGVHTPQDVIVGPLSAVVAIWLGGFLVDWVEKGSKNRDLVLLAIMIVFTAVSFYFFLNKAYPLDYDSDGNLLVDPVSMMPDTFMGYGVFLGVLVGWMVERRWINFTTDVTFEEKFARFAVGALVYMLLRGAMIDGMTRLFGSKIDGYFVGYFLLMFYATAIHPLCFTAWEKAARRKKLAA